MNSLGFAGFPERLRRKRGIADPYEFAVDFFPERRQEMCDALVDPLRYFHERVVGVAAFRLGSPSRLLEFLH